MTPLGPRILLVGAGAVGQTYGFHLQRGGADVSYFVKPAHAAAAREGYRVHVLNGRHRGSHDFSGFGVFCAPEEVRQQDWDQVWLCVSSPALRGPWLEPFLQAIGEASLVTLQPGLDDRSYLLARVPENRLVTGMISLVSYPSPLPGEDRAPGMAWWFPPLAPSPFGGPQALVHGVVSALKRGACPAKQARGVEASTAFGAALMMPTIAALEVAGWSFRALLSGAACALAVNGGRQASRIARPDSRGLLAWAISNPLTLRLLVTVAPRVVPFDLETYLRVHFTKVGDQTRRMLGVYCARAVAAQRPHDALAELAHRLGGDAGAGKGSVSEGRAVDGRVASADPKNRETDA